MMNIKPLYKNKLFGILLFIIGLFGVMVIVHRLCYYVYEFDAEFSPIDYGRFNILSFFTVQSNILVCFYLLVSAFAVFGVKKAQKIAFCPTFGAMVTTYIIVTGAVYCCGIPLGFTPPFTWDNPTHSMSSFIQVFHHMIIPPFMVVLWFFPATDKRVEHKKLLLFGIYPFVYSIFSIIRGAVSNPTFYPYPFYRPDFITSMISPDKPQNDVVGYLLMIPLLIIGIGLFIAVARLVVMINDKRTNK